VGREGLARVPAPEGDVIEMDEVCLRQSPALWLWVAASRLTRQVLGFVLGDRSDAMLEAAWGDVPPEYRGRPVCTDHWGAYARFFAEAQHQACDKGSGLTSIAEALNTKWRQRQSGLVRRACGVYVGIQDDLYERFLLLVESHNADCAERWRRLNPTHLNP
jgi:IS1 family transposase